METEQRLLIAAAEACIEHGFEGTTLSDIARRVGIRVPSIYNYYPTKSALLVAAARRAFEDRFGALATDERSPAETIAFMMSPALRDSRRLAIEIHSAATRHPDIAELLEAWHSDTVRAFRPFVNGPNADARLKAFFVLMLGTCHIDEFDNLAGANRIVRDHLTDMAAALFGDAGTEE